MSINYAEITCVYFLNLPFIRLFFTDSTLLVITRNSIECRAKLKNHTICCGLLWKSLAYMVWIFKLISVVFFASERICLWRTDMFINMNERTIEDIKILEIHLYFLQSIYKLILLCYNVKNQAERLTSLIKFATIYQTDRGSSALFRVQFNIW